MLGHMFENRNNTLKSVIKISDCLGRSLRENVQLFSIDSESKRASFVTESGFVIDGNFSSKKGTIVLENITIQDSEIFSDNEHFNNFVSSKIKNFISNIHESEYSNAGSSFDEILNLWETRLGFNEVKKRLEEKSQAFSITNDILETAEFQKFLEIAPQIISWLTENKEEITSISEIKNAVKLSNSVSLAFDIPKISLDRLEEQQSIEFTDGKNKSIYDLICRQELVTKELKESKNNFDIVWANNKNINALASLIYSGDKDKISATLSEALSDVPYLALATKKQLKETFSKTLQLENSIDIDFSDKDIKSFASIIFEMKKPIKDILIETINEKYGVNIQNLKEVASFRGLVEAQIVIFESLSRLAPKSSIIKDVLGEVSTMLREKSGVEAIDVNDILQAVFEKATYTTLCEDYSLTDKITLREMFENDLSPKDVVLLIESQAESVSDRIYSLLEKNKKYSEDPEEGGAEEEEKDKKKKKKQSPKDSDSPDTPEDVQKDLSGESKAVQYGESNEEDSEDEDFEDEDEDFEQESTPPKNKMSKEDFFASLDSITNLLSGDEDSKEVEDGV